ncbi:hypothetical protein ACHAXA_007114 [Cyclostephanos tholiformis]|uniref:Enhancer of polycomb-like protein n=1 Tax=Cyclostephanos tholiformis TaxID=382380 RepID=A0ABD3RYG1_9STRA
MVLEEMRPYLLQDGGNIAISKIDGPVVRLELQVVQSLPDTPDLNEEQIYVVLDTVRPFLQVAGGTINVRSITGEGGLQPTITLKMEGAAALLNSIKLEIAQRLRRHFMISDGGAPSSSVAMAVPGAESSSFSSSSLSSSSSSVAAAAVPPPPPPPRASSSAPIVVARPPLNVYLRLAVIRDNNDVVICDDPERPGRKKVIPMRQLSSLDGGGGGGGGTSRDHVEVGNDEGNDGVGRTSTTAASSAPGIKRKQDGGGNDGADQDKKNENNSKDTNNKKEIPVPTITTVRRYDRDVPPNFDVSTSYVRHIRPSYEEIMNVAVEYNLDADDERWWRENMDFGPFAKARILVPPDVIPAAGMGEEDEEEVDYDDDKGRRNGPSDLEGTTEENALKKVGQSTNIVKHQQQQMQGKQLGRKKKGRKNASEKINSTLMNATENASAHDAAMDVDDTNSEMSSTQLMPPPALDSAAAFSHDLTIEEVILLNPRYLHSRHSTRRLIQRYNPKLPLPSFERMMDALEKATGHESIVTIAQAEEMLVARMPCLVDIFGPLSEKERRMEEEEDERHLSRWLKDDSDMKDGGWERSGSERPRQGHHRLPTLAPPITLPEVIRQVYNYWMAKRSRLRKPLLRRFCPPTSASDLNPHQVFRQREKEKRRLRKKRQNDLEAYRKMRQLRMDFERLGTLCDLILRREEVNSTLVELTNEYFEERLHGWMDTTGLPRRSRTLDRRSIERVLNVPKYFDDRPIARTRAGNKRKRGPQTGWKNGGVDGSRDPSPVPQGGGSTGIGGPHPAIPAAGVGNNHLPHHQGSMKPPPPPMTAMTHLPPKNIVVAGHDGGFPAPNFLQPLASRESHFATSWDDVVPSIPSYINGACTTSLGGLDGGGVIPYRHRPRLGRGGRIIIDRVPRPSFMFGGGGVAGPPAPTVVTYGSPMGMCEYHLAPLGADGPNAVRSSGGLDNDDGSRGSNPDVSEEGRGTDARSAPRAPPARNLEDLLPKSLGDATLLSRRIEEICALGLMEDYRAKAIGGIDTAASASASSRAGNNNVASSGATTTLADEMDEILVPIEDWMEAPEGLRLYGSERFVIGPL